jgi:hypothetical protein
MTKKIIYDVMSAFLAADKPSKFFESLKENNTINNYIDVFFPELSAHPDMWNKTMNALDKAAERRNSVSDPDNFMLAALCSNLSKSETEDFLRRMEISEDEINYIHEMLQHYYALHSCFENKSRIRSTNYVFRSMKQQLNDVFQLCFANNISDDEMEFLIWRFAIYKNVMPCKIEVEVELF